MDLVRYLAVAITDLSRTRDRVLVAIDGPDAAGKTTLADQLAGAVSIPAVRASVDDFQQPRSVRYARGPLSGEGYYRDSFDRSALTAQCLQPFRDGAPRVVTATCDYRTDTPVHREAAPVPSRAVLIVDGVFLLDQELRTLWTLSVHLRVSEEEVLRRARRRDVETFGSLDDVELRYLSRYLPGQALYRQDADPEAAAHVLVDNDDPAAPVLVRAAPQLPRIPR